MRGGASNTYIKRYLKISKVNSSFLSSFCLTSLLLRSLSLCPSYSYDDVFHVWRFSCWVTHPISFVISVLLLASSMLTSFLMGFKAFGPFRSNADFFHGCWRPDPLVSCNNDTRWQNICSGSFPPSYVSLVTSLKLTFLTSSSSTSLLQCWLSFSPTRSCYNADVTYFPIFFLLNVLMLTSLLSSSFLLQCRRHSLPHPLPAPCSNADVPPLLPFPVTVLMSITSPSSSCSIF